MTGVGAWIRYGDPLLPGQLEFAAEHYRAAILQPWEVDAAEELKRLRPDMTVLCYKCLSSVRSYEPGPVFTSGVSYGEADADGVWFATRLDGSRIEWERYPGHWQMRVWDPDYQRRWVGNVVEELRDSPFDGVMADNDVFDDYYGLRLPIEGATEMAALRTVGLRAGGPRARSYRRPGRRSTPPARSSCRTSPSRAANRGGGPHTPPTAGASRRSGSATAPWTCSIR